MKCARRVQVSDAARHVKLTLYPKKSVIEYENTDIKVVTVSRGDTLFWVVYPDQNGRPEPGTHVVPFADIQKDRSLVIGAVPGLADDSRLPPYELKKQPIQSATAQRP